MKCVNISFKISLRQSNKSNIVIILQSCISPFPYSLDWSIQKHNTTVTSKCYWKHKAQVEQNQVKHNEIDLLSKLTKTASFAIFIFWVLNIFFIKQDASLFHIEFLLWTRGNGFSSYPRTATEWKKVQNSQKTIASAIETIIWTKSAIISNSTIS